MTMHSLLPGSGYRPSKRKVNLLAFVTARVGPEVLPHLLHRPDVNIKVVSDSSKAEFQEYLGDGTNLAGLHWIENAPVDPYKRQQQMQGHKLARWADVMLLIADAGMISLMLAGFTTDVILHAIRCWDVSKRMLLLPEMSVEESTNPMWRRQMSKLQRRWDWVHLLEPAIWTFTALDGPADALNLEHEEEIEWTWAGPSELLESLHSETQMVLRKARAVALTPLQPKSSPSSKPALPPEIWTHVFDFLGDWEVATALNIYTHLPTPSHWHGLVPAPGSKARSLEWIILTQPLALVKCFFERQTKDQSPPTLSSISLDVIFRFARTDVLTYLASNQKDIFWTSFPSDILPHKASVVYNSPAILQWWKDCPAVIQKVYNAQAMDGASRLGFIEVLQWWLESGLPLHYTDRALENASSRGLVEVLEWWRTNSQKLVGTERELPLKVGKSIWLAAQCGRPQSIAWWERSGIAYSHEERVATVASQGGHVDVLDLWYSLKGSKMIFDNQVLVGPTKHGYARVLEWWKEASRKWGLRVEYKTCDIEEALEDAVGGGGEGEVREWWARNGLNLGVGTGEWMKVKTL